VKARADGWRDESDALHARVRAFAAGEGGDTFEALALDIARFQAAYNEGYARLLSLSPGALERGEIVPVPSEAFRHTRVAVHPESEDEVTFFSSGTTAEGRSTHPMRTTRTYRELSLIHGRKALLAEELPLVAVLAEEPKAVPTSSLNFMLREFLQAFDAKPRLQASERALRRWLLSESGVDIEELERARALAETAACPLLLLGTSAAFDLLLEQRGPLPFELPAGSILMHTGGPKRRQGGLDLPLLERRLGAAFMLEPCQIVGEYGMTELTSQLYEGTAEGVELKGSKGLFIPPAWLRVQAVDPVTLAVLPEGECGLARFTDLGNIDSAVCVLTQDLVVVEEAGVRLKGRQAGALPRGCSLAVEALLEGPR
jgi:hypothetical protein